jgi:predicted dehydrogenase
MTAINAPLNRKLRMALIGGGGSGFIGRVHATAGTLDQRAELVAGVLSSDPEKSRSYGPGFGLAADRTYGSYQDLLAGENARPEDDRIDFVSIATPNDTHFPIAKAALEAGFHVICDKPLTTRLEDAHALASLVQETGSVFAVTHNYTGYPLIRQAREMIKQGELGTIKAVRAHYLQGWLWGLPPDTTPARGAWKADPQRAGPSGALADIGTHAYQLIRYTTGLLPEQVSAHLQSLRPDRTLDDYGHVLVRFADSVLGSVTVSQITHGRLNDLTLEIDGSLGSLTWRQETPNELIVRRFGQPVQVYERNPNADFTHATASAACRLPAGHPEAFFEAFANVYRSSYDQMIAHATGQTVEPRDTLFPNVHDGIEGVEFIEQCVTSSADNGAWQPLSC